VQVTLTTERGQVVAAGGHPARLRAAVAGATTVVAATRLVLTVHWPSDVAAALALGLALRQVFPDGR
jgi:membrane-associated phospholipid phosphatase